MMNMHDSLNCVGLRVGDVHIITVNLREQLLITEHLIQ
jgi:hypothetical protein